jgi:hypothetical protein
MLATSERVGAGIGVGVGVVAVVEADDKNGIASRAGAVGAARMSRASPVQMMMAAVDDDVGGVDDVDGVGVDVGIDEEFARAAFVGPGVASATAAAAADAGEHGGSAADAGVEAHAEAVVDGAVAMAAAAAVAAAGVAEARGADERPEEAAAVAAASRTWTAKLASRSALVVVVVGDGAVVVGKVAGAGGIGAVGPAAAALGAAAVAGSAAVGTRQLDFQGIPNLPTG